MNRIVALSAVITLSAIMFMGCDDKVKQNGDHHDIHDIREADRSDLRERLLQRKIITHIRPQKCVSLVFELYFG